MSEARFTPGPWAFGYEAGGITGPTCPRIDGPCVGGRETGYTVVTVPGRYARAVVAICPDQDHVAGSGARNARLISAAPELFKAVLDCLKELDRSERPSYAWQLRAKAAIDRAEGRSTPTDMEEVSHG